MTYSNNRPVSIGDQVSGMDETTGTLVAGTVCAINDQGGNYLIGVVPSKEIQWINPGVCSRQYDLLPEAYTPPDANSDPNQALDIPEGVNGEILAGDQAAQDAAATEKATEWGH